jgi:acetolactate synthase-1/2/3 large subunit
MTVLSERTTSSITQSEPVRKSGQRLFAEMVHGYGITHVFFVPTILTPALAEMGTLSPRITRITAHSEKAAAYMADGYARASKRPGLAMAQTVGAANLAAGLKDAWLAGSPLIAISGGPTPNSRYRHNYQELRDDFSMFGEVTKFSARVERVERLPDLFRLAVRAAVTGAPGPAHLEIGGEQGHAANDELELQMIIEERYKQLPPFRPAAEQRDVRAALELLARAERPVIVVGGGATTSGAQREVQSLVERLNIPFVTSLNGKSGFDDAHPLNIGVVGSYSRECANRLVAESDLVLFVGSHTGGQVTASWKIPRPGTPVIQIDIDPLELGRNYPNSVSLLGDAQTVLRQILDEAQAGSNSRRGWVEHAQELLRDWRAEYADLMGSDAVPMRPERVCQELSEALPDDVIVVVDTGHSGMWTGQMLALKESQTYLRAAGSLGWSFPASLGAKCAFPDRPVLCFTGDGGFFYHATELETAARNGINAVILVNNNYSLNQDFGPFNAAYKGNQTEGFEMWQFSKQTDFAKMAESMGCMGIVVERANELKAALSKAFAADRPVVLDVRTDIEAMAPRAWTGGENVTRAGVTY